MKKILVSFLIAALLASCATPPAPRGALAPAGERLVDAMARRLALADEIAWIKYRDARPVGDPTREAAVVNGVATAAARRGLDPATTRAFFAAQIAASRAQQEKLIHLWKRGAPLPAREPRPAAEIRRDIDAADQALLAALAQPAPPPRSLRAWAERSLRARGVYWVPARLATAPLCAPGR